ncbi:MAG: cell division protein FtsQ/DivIB [Nitrospinaceae bacterium]
MDYALASHKSPAAAWGELQSQRRRKRKKDGDFLRAGRNPKFFAAVWVLIRALINLTVKFIMVAVCSYGIYSGYLFLIASPRFAVSQINFSGNHKVQEDKLREWAGPVTGENIFLLDLDDISRRLARHPWVRSVSARKVFPHSLLVEVVERVPYARIKLDRVYVMDNFGVLLAYDGPAYQDLPLVVQPGAAPLGLGQNAAADGVIQCLQTMHYLNKLSFFRKNPLQSAKLNDYSRITLYTRDSSLRMVMDPNSLSEGFQNFMIVLETLGEDGKGVGLIDLSFKDQVVVQHKNHLRTTRNIKKGSPS